jgi:hypothetical protein
MVQLKEQNQHDGDNIALTPGLGDVEDIDPPERCTLWLPVPRATPSTPTASGSAT